MEHAPLLLPKPDIALCVLTQSPHGSLEQRMAKSYASDGTPAVLMRWCVFRHERLTRAETMDWQVVRLSRPSFVSHLPHFQCVAKILAWLEHARRSQLVSPLGFIGWLDADTLLWPTRLHTFLSSWTAASTGPRVTPDAPPNATRPDVWVGNFMHWQRFHGAALDGLGFMHDSTGKEEQYAARMTFDRLAMRRQYLIDQRAWWLEVRANASRRHAESFAMAQGSLVLYSASAIPALIAYAKEAPLARGVLGRAASLRRPARHEGSPRGLLRGLPRLARPGKCTLPGDVALGLLTTRAFTGRRLVALALANFLEAFVWPTIGRFHENHTLVVHLAEVKRQGDRNVTAIIDALDGLVRHGAVTLATPGFTCGPSAWLHAAARSWVTCRNRIARHRRPTPSPRKMRSS